MKGLLRLMVLAGALVALPAQAKLITDVNNPYVKLGEGRSHEVTHDLRDDGVPADYFVSSAKLRLGFSDGILSGDWAVDLAGISGEGLAGTFEVDGTHVFGYDIRWLSVGQPGIDVLNDIGQLVVTVTALRTPGCCQGYNDFWWKTSKLIAHVEPKDVPEPGTLGLLGLGLVAAGLARRRQLAA